MTALSVLSSSLQCRLKWLDIELRNERINMLLRDDSHSALKGLLPFLKAPSWLLVALVIISFLQETYFCLALIAFLVYLSYRLVMFFFQDTFELRININDWHFDFSWNHIQQTPATATPVTWNSSTTTVINPTPEEDLWPGHPAWNSTTWNTPTVQGAIHNVVQQFSANHPTSFYWPLEEEEDL
ncbi:hypothetical protein PAXINDRAFT_19767 [Paxillus involutus ATCC 200175]|uniref:Uncharacterized protein n=1 Tax=Paxillus involutus ATCC 200175 TaxID=664439 RepID=A0A0C9TIA0_PAXIN|nr:hypothetical protein PAXINDRAFT_19767 [Paxillus involutus ATCC 200175]